MSRPIITDSLPNKIRDLERASNTAEIRDVIKEPLPYAAGWSDLASPSEPATYSRIGNLVLLQGSVTKSTTPATGDVIATLPVGFRPVGNISFASATGSPDAFGRIRVVSDGTIVWIAGSTGATNFATLSGMIFIPA